MKKLTLILLGGCLLAATSCKFTEAIPMKVSISEIETTTTEVTTKKISLDDALARQEEMYTTLGLSEKQKTSFKEIETKYAKKMREVKDANAGDKDEMYDQLADIQEDKEAEIEKLLTVKQFEAYKVELEKMRAERREGRE
jgi:hypothetical protein